MENEGGREDGRWKIKEETRGNNWDGRKEDRENGGETNIRLRDRRKERVRVMEKERE